MGSVESEVEAGNKRAELLDWLNGLVPDFDVPIDSSEEELREQLYDCTVLFSILNRLVPGITERVVNGKKFLSVLEERGVPGFDITDLEQGSMSTVVDCLLSVRDNLNSSAPGEMEISSENTSKSGILRNKWRPPVTKGQQSSAALIVQKRKAHLDSKSHHTSRGKKFREVFQLKKGTYSELQAAKISEMMHSNSLDNATTQSLLSVVNGILDESIERKKLKAITNQSLNESFLAY